MVFVGGAIARQSLASTPEIDYNITMSNRRILFIDDDEFLRECTCWMLSDLGYDVVVENGGRKAVERFQDSPGSFDLVLTDLMMADMTGDMVAQSIHAIRPDVPVVVMTGTPGSLVGKPEAAGISKVLPKPLTKRELGEALRNVK